MAGFLFTLFLLSVILIFAAFNTAVAVQKTASYPPKRVLRKKATILGISGTTVFLLAFILYYVT